jgi:hypothetical protein
VRLEQAGPGLHSPAVGRAGAQFPDAPSLSFPLFRGGKISGPAGSPALGCRKLRKCRLPEPGGLGWRSTGSGSLSQVSASGDRMGGIWPEWPGW